MVESAASSGALSNEALLAQMSDEDDMNQDSNFQYAVIGDENCTRMKEDILDYLHQKDLLSTVDITSVYGKNQQTFLLAVDEDITSERIDQINKALRSHGVFGPKSYKMVNWEAYRQMSNRSTHETNSDDEDYFVGAFEEADNTGGGGKQVINRRRNVISKRLEQQMQEDLSRKDKEKVEATIYGIEASINAWLNAERSK